MRSRESAGTMVNVVVVKLTAAVFAFRRSQNDLSHATSKYARDEIKVSDHHPNQGAFRSEALASF